jgi:hypothetical protein
MNIITTTLFVENKGYRCRGKKCKKVCSLKAGTKFSGFRIEFKKILLCIYYFVFSSPNYLAASMIGIAEGTYIEFRSLLMEIIADQRKK